MKNQATSTHIFMVNDNYIATKNGVISSRNSLLMQQMAIGEQSRGPHTEVDFPICTL